MPSSGLNDFPSVYITVFFIKMLGTKRREKNSLSHVGEKDSIQGHQSGYL